MLADLCEQMAGGLSPLTRGNRPAHVGRVPRAGPIPAHAGQPCPLDRHRKRSRAYPRSRGATGELGHCCCRRQGLSPLTRGNPGALLTFPSRRGPIPAHAGQPNFHDYRPGWSGAYPRSRGATRASCRPGRSHEGLSPLTRGNHRSKIPDDIAAWPIPAHAGQPPCTPPRRSGAWAYPRSRGATYGSAVVQGPRWGLSPLTRGNPTDSASAPYILGPIPAHAGQPSAPFNQQGPDGAYPRSRGATLRLAPAFPCRPGLSPLTRGNPDTRNKIHRASGPIPAHAGQPAHRACSR